MDKGSTFAHQLVAINPIWAEKIAAAYPRMEDVQERLYSFAHIESERFPVTLRPVLENGRRFHDGRVYLMDSPEDVSVIVNGGTGNLHATMLPEMSNLLPVTRSLEQSTWPDDNRPHGQGITMSSGHRYEGTSKSHGMAR